jgi:tetratricopeptide (TPR) repeat protein
MIATHSIIRLHYPQPLFCKYQEENMKIERGALSKFVCLVLTLCATATGAKSENTQAHNQKEIALQHPEIMTLINKADELSNSGEPKEALEVCNEAISISPYFALSYIVLSGIHGNLGQFDEAIKDADKSIQLDPNSAIAYSNKGIALYALGAGQKSKDKMNEAIKSFSKAISLDSKEANGFMRRGKCYLFLDQVVQAQKDFNSAIDLNPKLSRAYVWRAKTYEKLKHHDLAITDMNKAKSLDYPTTE